MGRLRVTFGRGDAVKYVSHLDLLRVWERAFRRAGVPLAYSAGFTPRPKLQVAAALAVGVTSEAEIMDLVLDEEWSPEEFAARVAPQLPAGITLVAVCPGPVGKTPALPAIVSAADYRVVLAATESPEAARARIDRLLDQASLARVREREGKPPKRYDLRPLILDLREAGTGPDGQSLEMRLRLSNEGGGRPDEVIAALGYDERPRRIHRVRLYLDEDAPVLAGADLLAGHNSIAGLPHGDEAGDTTGRTEAPNRPRRIAGLSHAEGVGGTVQIELDGPRGSDAAGEAAREESDTR